MELIVKNKLQLLLFALIIFLLTVLTGCGNSNPSAYSTNSESQNINNTSTMTRDSGGDTNAMMRNSMGNTTTPQEASPPIPPAQGDTNSTQPLMNEEMPRNSTPPSAMTNSTMPLQNSMTN